MASAFPEPLDSSPPDWAFAIIAAAVGVTLLWIIAIAVLVLFQIFKKSGSSYPLVESHTPHPASEEIRSKRDTSTKVTSHPPSILLHSTDESPPLVEAAASSSAGVQDLPDDSGTTKQLGELKKLEIVDGCQSSCESLNSHNSYDQTQEKSKPALSQNLQSNVAGATDVTSLDSNENQDSTLSGMVLSRPVTVRQLGATIREPNYIETEFRKLPSLNVSTNDLPPGTERKNRYTNVLPTPRTRVILPLIVDHPNSDFINANYIRGCRGSPKQYIATQGPLESTIEDFWRMILDNNTTIIVMVTNFQEKGIEKCSRYWPAQGSEEYGSVQVTLLQQNAHGNYNSSTLQVQATGSVARTVMHYRITCWPQQGVPKDTKPITDFLRLIKIGESSGPAVVHCSAGIGRTGVLIACDIGLQGILQGDPRIDVLRIVSTLRQDRSGMVQTRDQYRFIHQALYNVSKEEGAK